jgi:hypothetical protein
MQLPSDITKGFRHGRRDVSAFPGAYLTESLSFGLHTNEVTVDDSTTQTIFHLPSQQKQQIRMRFKLYLLV